MGGGVEGILIMMFGQTAARAMGAYGPIVGLVVTILGAAFLVAIALYGYRKKMEYDLQRQEAVAKLQAAERERQAEAIRLQALEQQRKAEEHLREQERLELRNQEHKARERLEGLVLAHQRLLTNHLEHDKLEREAVIKAMANFDARSEAQSEAMTRLVDGIATMHRDLVDRLPRKAS